MPADPFRCSSHSAALGERMDATASTVANWLFLEQPGPWGSDALARSRLWPRFARRLRARSQEFGFRPILIRPPGRSRQPLAARGCFLIHAGPDLPWLAPLRLERPEDLRDEDLAALGRGQAPAGRPTTDDRLLVVCTNGQRDPCCAERGRPLARTLAAEFGDAVWECSHIGGDRFAGNLVCFPHGLYFGRLDPELGVAAAAAYMDGRIDLDHYRGRSCYPFDVQAAEFFVRRTTGLDGLDDLRFEARVPAADGGVLVGFVGPSGERLAARVGMQPAEPRRLTCHADRVLRPPVFLVDWEPIERS